MRETDGFGPRIKALRRARGMTLRDVQRASGVSISHVSEIENGSDGVGLGVLSRLANAYGVTVGTMLDGRPPDPLPPTPSERWLLCPHCQKRVARIEDDR